MSLRSMVASGVRCCAGVGKSLPVLGLLSPCVSSPRSGAHTTHTTPTYRDTQYTDARILYSKITTTLDIDIFLLISM